MYGKRIREVRMKRKLTQQNTADTLNLTLRSYQRYEKGDFEPSLATLVAIADLFNVPTDYLLGRDDYLKSLGVSVDELL